MCASDEATMAEGGLSIPSASSSCSDTTHGPKTQLSFCRLVYHLERQRRLFYDRLLEQHGIGAPHVPVLALLWHDHGRDTQATLAEELGVDPATITRCLTRIEQLGYVTRDISARDTRAYLVKLTEPGRDAARAAVRASGAWNETLVTGWPDARRREALVAMSDMLANARRSHLEGD